MRVPPCDKQSIEIQKPIQKMHTVGIVQTFTKQHPKTSLRAGSGTMYRVATDEAMIGGKEEIGVGTRQTGKSVKCGTVYSHKDRRGKARLGEEFNPVHIVVFRHDH
jgi:hypothetical protein